MDRIDNDFEQNQHKKREFNTFTEFPFKNLLSITLSKIVPQSEEVYMLLLI